MKKLLLLLLLIPNLVLANDGIVDRFDNDMDNELMTDQ